MRVDLLGRMLRPFTRRAHNGIGLMAVLRGESAVRAFVITSLRRRRPARLRTYPSVGDRRRP